MARPPEFVGIRARAPCQNCEKRTVGCHGTCEAYIQFQKKAEEERAVVRSLNNADYLAYRHEFFTKIKHRQGMQNELKGKVVIRK